MRDLIKDKEINDSYGLITSRDMIAEYINRAIAAEADVRRLEEELSRNFKGEIQAKLEMERLRWQVEKMKNCGNCKWFQEEGECVNSKNTEQDCEYYRGFFWEAED